MIRDFQNVIRNGIATMYMGNDEQNQLANNLDNL